jgi:signal transduction histidine kinase
MKREKKSLYDNEDDRRLAEIISIIVLATWAGYLFVLILGFFFHDQSLIILTIAGTVVLGGAMVLLRKLELKASSLLLVLIELATIITIATVGQGIHDLAMLGIPIIILFAGLVLDKAFFRLSVGFILVAILWLSFGEKFGWFVTKPFEGEMEDWFYLVGVVVIMLITALAVDLLGKNIRTNLELARNEIAQRRQAEAELQRIIKRSNQMADQFQMVIQIGNKINSGLDFEKRMLMVYEQCQQLGDTDTFYVATYDDQTSLVCFPFFMKEGELRNVEERNIKDNSGLTGYVIESRQTLYIPDQSDLPAGISLIRTPGIWTHSYIGVPMTINEKVVGVLSLQSNLPNAYTPDQIKTLELVATQVAIAIQNSQLYEHVKQELTERKRIEQEVFMLNAFLEKRVEERTHELNEAQEQLVRKEKLATLGMLAGSVGHELRNPLGVINSSIYYLDLVQQQADEKIKQHHAMIQQEVRNADKIISDLLDFGRNINADRELVSVPEIVQSSLKRFPVPAALKVMLELPTDLPKVFADPRQVEQILGNLTTNACQVMITESSSMEGFTDGVLTISARKQKEMVEISVKDTGPGIPPENMEKLFEPLFTTKTKGIGLGLAVSRKLAEANGGWMDVDSSPGMGSTFSVYLPVGEK